jgi:hypothetical protein
MAWGASLGTGFESAWRGRPEKRKSRRLLETGENAGITFLA